MSAPLSPPTPTTSFEPPGRSGATPAGVPPDGPPFDATLARESARTAIAEGQKESPSGQALTRPAPTRRRPMAALAAARERRPSALRARWELNRPPMQRRPHPNPLRVELRPPARRPVLSKPQVCPAPSPRPSRAKLPLHPPARRRPPARARVGLAGASQPLGCPARVRPCRRARRLPPPSRTPVTGQEPGPADAPSTAPDRANGSHVEEGASPAAPTGESGSTTVDSSAPPAAGAAAELGESGSGTRATPIGPSGSGEAPAPPSGSGEASASASGSGEASASASGSGETPAAASGSGEAPVRNAEAQAEAGAQRPGAAAQLAASGERPGPQAG